MKRKLLASTVAASLVLGSVAGLPLSTEGLFQKLGVKAAYAAPEGLQTITDEMNQIHNYLWDETEKQSVREVRNALHELDKDPANESLVSEISARINGNVTPAELLTLFSSLGLFFNTNGKELTDSLSRPEIQEILGKIAVLGGSSMGKLTIKDAADYAMAIEVALKNQIKDKSLVELALLAKDQQKMEDVIKVAITNVMGTSNNFSTVISNIGITAGDVAAVTRKIVAKVDPDRSATTIIALAILRADANASFAKTSEYPSNSRTQKYTFTILGKTSPDILSWASGNERVNVQFEQNTGKLIATMTGTGTLSSDITGSINLPGTYLHGKALVKQTVSLSFVEDSSTNNPPSGGGGGGGGGAPSSTPPAAAEAAKAIDDIKKEIQNATPEKKAELIAQAVAKVEQALAKIATIDLSSKITVTGDKAVPQLNVTELVNTIKNIAAEAKKLTDALKELDPNAQVKPPALTLDFGNITAKTLEVPLSKELLAALKDNGLSAVNIKSNGVGISIPSNVLSGDTTLTVSKQDASVAAKATNKPVASDVVEVHLSGTNGFSEAVLLSLTINEPAKFDKELLTMIKIDGNNTTNYGGKYNESSQQVDTKRNSLSTYTVIENKVTFNDTASVQSWAGRQIQVAAAKGIVEGRAEGQFVPNETVTRAEFAKMIVNTFGLEDAQATESFDDVNDQDWFKSYVAAAVKNGLVNGRSEGKFDPNGQITRAEMATIAARALMKVNNVKAVADVNGALKGFGDVAAVHDSLKAGIALSAAQGIVVGEEGGKFNPGADSTRAQAAVVIYRLLNK